MVCSTENGDTMAVLVPSKIRGGDDLSLAESREMREVEYRSREEERSLSMAAALTTVKRITGESDAGQQNDAGQ